MLWLWALFQDHKLRLPEVPEEWATGQPAESEGPLRFWSAESVIVLNSISKCCSFHVLFKGMLVVWYLLYPENGRIGSHTSGHLALEGGPWREREFMCFWAEGKAIQNSLQRLVLFVFFLLTHTITIHLRLKIRRYSRVHDVRTSPHFQVSQERFEWERPISSTWAPDGLQTSVRFSILMSSDVGSLSSDNARQIVRGRRKGYFFSLSSSWN